MLKFLPLNSKSSGHQCSVANQSPTLWNQTLRPWRQKSSTSNLLWYGGAELIRPTTVTGISGAFSTARLTFDERSTSRTCGAISAGLCLGDSFLDPVSNPRSDPDLISRPMLGAIRDRAGCDSGARGGLWMLRRSVSGVSFAACGFIFSTLAHRTR